MHNSETKHIKTWKEFKQLADTLKPSTVGYAMQRAPLCKPPIGLRLIFTVENAQYVFLDLAKDDALRQTKIPVEINAYGDAFVDEDEIKNFLRSQLNREDLRIYSLEVIGY